MRNNLNMKKLIGVLLVLFVSCTSVPREKDGSSPADRKDLSITKEDLDRELDSLTAEGEYCLIRGSDREYDTIIDHIRYKYVKDFGQDTPINDTIMCSEGMERLL